MYPQSNSTYVDASFELWDSGILGALRPRAGQFLQQLAAFSIKNTAHKDYRRAYANQTAWAAKFNLKQATVCEAFRELERAGVIKKVGKKGRSNRYEIAHFDELCRVAVRLLESKLNRRRTANLEPGRSIGTNGYIGNDDLSDCSNSYVSDCSNSKGQELSDCSNTEVEVGLEVERENGNIGSPFSEMERSKSETQGPRSTNREGGYKGKERSKPKPDCPDCFAPVEREGDLCESCLNGRIATDAARERFRAIPMDNQTRTLAWSEFKEQTKGYPWARKADALHAMCDHLQPAHPLAAD